MMTAKAMTKREKVEAASVRVQTYSKYHTGVSEPQGIQSSYCVNYDKKECQITRQLEFGTSSSKTETPTSNVTVFELFTS